MGCGVEITRGMKIRRNFLGLLLMTLVSVSFTSCDKLKDELFGGDNEPIQSNYSVALAGKWKVVEAGYLEWQPDDVERVADGKECPTSLEWVEFADGKAHFHFSQPVTLDYEIMGGSERPSIQITDYTCDCELDGRGLCDFGFGYKYFEVLNDYVEGCTVYELLDEHCYVYLGLSAYGRDEDYATTLILYSSYYFEDSAYGYVMKRYDD